MRGFVFLFLLLAACNAHMITMDRYQDVVIGLSVVELENQFGKPYAIHHKENGMEYEYIERITAADRPLFDRHYFFMIQEGKVTAKRTKVDKEVPLDDRNSFDLQTSQSF